MKNVHTQLNTRRKTEDVRKARWGALGLLGAAAAAFLIGPAPAGAQADYAQADYAQADYAQADYGQADGADAVAAKCDLFLQQRLWDNSEHAVWEGSTPKAGPTVPSSPDRPIYAHAMAGIATGSNGYTSIVVRLSQTLTPAVQAQLQAVSTQTVAYFPMINSVALRVPTSLLPFLAKLPFVQRLSSDELVLRTDAITVGESGADVAFSQYALTGKGVTVAVLDSGLRYTGKDLSDPVTGASRVLAGVSFIPGDATTDDAYGHGTHVAGIIAGSGADSGAFNKAPGLRKKAITGIAPGANLVNVRVLDKNGQSDTFAILSGIQWVLNHQAQYNIRVMNLSLGHPVGESCATDPLCQAVEAAYRAGITVVCAAGNGGRVQDTSPTPTSGLTNEGFGTNYGSILSPANDPYVVTVGAMKTVDGKRVDDRIATYSGRGPSLGDHILKPDLVAPGNLITSLRAVGSALDVQYPANVAANPAYFTLSGTSMASPVVAGAVALMLQQNPALTPDTIKARLMASADKWTDGVGNGSALAYGAGYLDIPAALACPFVPATAAVSPQLIEDALGDVLVDPTVANAHVVWGANVVWGTNVVWGAHVVWGTNAIANSHVIWGSNVIWGSDIAASCHVVWGTSFGTVESLFQAGGDPGGVVAK